MGWLAAAALIGLWPASAGATIAQALSMRELVQEADHVVLATATGASARRDARQRIVTDFTLRVDEVMKGDSAVGSELVMMRLGGVLGDLGMRVEGEPSLAVGQQYLLFLRRSSDGGALRPVGMSQGVMPVERGRGGALLVQPGGQGMALVDRVRGGQLVASPPALLHPEAYEQVRERVEQMIEGDADGSGERRDNGAVQR